MGVFSGRQVHGLALAILLILPLVFFWELIVEGQEPVAPDIQAWGILAVDRME